MPYTIKEENGKFCVHKKHQITGEPMGESFGCHPTKEQAVAQIGAIESSERRNSIQFKEDASGQMWFIGTYSNQFKDRHDEIISEQAHLEYIKWLEETGVKPQVTFYHMPKYAPGFWVSILKAHELGLINTNTLNGIMRDFYKDYAIAETEKVIYTNGFTVVVAKVHSSKIDFIKSLQDASDELGMSHGFVALKTSGNIYEGYKSFEYSVLHRARAANVYTDTRFLGGLKEPMKPEEKEFLNGISEGLGEDIENSTKELQEELKNDGVEFKDEGTPEPVETEEVKQEEEKQEEEAAPEVLKAEELVGVLVEKISTALNIPGLVEALKTELDAFRTEIRDGMQKFDERVKQVEVSEDEKIARQYEPNWAQLFKGLTNTPPTPKEEKKDADPLKGWENVEPEKIYWTNTFKG